MKLLSVNVGRPGTYSYEGKSVLTAIFKSPVQEKRKVTKTNIEGDGQGDIVHHGGELKAVYSYDIAYYDHWKRILQRNDWGYGLFGENLTTEGLTDDKVLIGNIYKIGSVYLKAIQPRFPCYKLNIRFEAVDMLQQFMQHGKYGTYYKVEEEGTIEPGDDIVLAETSPHQITIEQYAASYYNKGADKNILEQILAIEYLSERNRKAFESFTGK